LGRGSISKCAESEVRSRELTALVKTKDLEALQKRALEEGLPYQTLISSVLHKYVSGRLLDRRAGRGFDCRSREAGIVA